MATLETDIRVHDAMTMGAFHGLWYFCSVVWNFHVMANLIIRLKNLLMVFYENGLEVLLLQTLLPTIKILQDCQHFFPTDHYNARPLAEHSPFFLFLLVGNQFFDM